MKRTHAVALSAIFLATLFATFLSCASSSTGGELAETSLRGAIEQSARQMAGDLPAGTRVAIVAFESESDNLSYYIMEELTGALFALGIEVADRQNLPYVMQELRLSLDDAVSDEGVQRIGHILAAELVSTGQLWNLGDTRRLSTSAIHVETAVRRSVPRFDLANNRAMRNMVAALDSQPLTARVSSVLYYSFCKSTKQVNSLFYK